MAHSDRRVTGMLNLPLVGEGAHGVDRNSSLEILLASGTVRRRWGQGYRACQSKVKGCVRRARYQGTCVHHRIVSGRSELTRKPHRSEWQAVALRVIIVVD